MEASRREWDRYEETRPGGVPLRLWNNTGGRVKGRVGEEQPRFEGRRRLSNEEYVLIKRRATLSAPSPEQLVPATIVIDGDEAYLLPQGS
jgi:hypothetical protein